MENVEFAALELHDLYRLALAQLVHEILEADRAIFNLCRLIQVITHQIFYQTVRPRERIPFIVLLEVVALVRHLPADDHSRRQDHVEDAVDVKASLQNQSSAVQVGVLRVVVLVLSETGEENRFNPADGQSHD